MKLCAKGASRQEGHERIRVLSNEAGSVVKNEVSPIVLPMRMDSDSRRVNRTTSFRGSGATASLSPSGTNLTACSGQNSTLAAASRLSISTAAQVVRLRRLSRPTRRTSRPPPPQSSTFSLGAYNADRLACGARTEGCEGSLGGHTS